MLSIHGYFMTLGVDEIRRRGAQDEKSLRMVKTLVHELCRQMVSFEHQAAQDSRSSFAIRICCLADKIRRWRQSTKCNLAHIQLRCKSSVKLERKVVLCTIQAHVT